MISISHKSSNASPEGRRPPLQIRKTLVTEFLHGDLPSLIFAHSQACLFPRILVRISTAGPRWNLRHHLPITASCSGSA